jgi:hypothetical protein
MNATLLEPPPLAAPASLAEALLTDVPHADRAPKLRHRMSGPRAEHRT